MSNYFQQGPAGFLPDSTSPPRRRSSFAPISVNPTAAGRPHRAGAVAHLLNPSPDGSDVHSTAYGATRNLGLDTASSRAPGDDPRGSTRQPRPTALPWFSRAFDTCLSKDSVLLGDEYDLVLGAGSPGFLAPSYLKGSVYLQKLEEAHKSRIVAQRRAQQQSTQPHAPGAGPLPSNGSGGGSGGVGGLGLNVGPKLGAPPSHRGMTFDVVEKPAALEEDEAVSPLPSRWNKEAKHPALEVLGDGYEVKCVNPRAHEREHEACSIRADHTMPPQCGVYYFEVLVLNRKREETTVVIGLTTKDVSLMRVPGWEPESWGFHGDDGHCYSSQNVGRSYGPKFGPGDTVGCLVNFRTGCVSFTKNGDDLGVAYRDINSRDLKGRLFPTVGLKRMSEHVWANFGQAPFQFNIDGYMQKEKREILGNIDTADTSSLAPPYNETELVQQLVLQFLQHDGYVETARAFANEIHAEKTALNLDPNVEVEGINIKDDEDANKRQQIRRAVLQGRMELALKYTNTFYPGVLEENEQVYFRLRCRRFIEMIRKDAEANMRMEANPEMERKGFSTRPGHRHSGEDEEMVEADGSEEWDERMDTEDANDDDEDGGIPLDIGEEPPVGKLLEEALQYGQELRAEFDGEEHREMAKQLDQVFALIAYPNPLKVKEVAHLLDRTGRVAVAEELNSAILHSLGKSSRTALETVYAQTEVLLDDLRQDGGDGAFITIRELIDDIPRPQLLP